MILITAKIHPDIDGVAVMIAYEELLRVQGVKNARARIFGQAQIEAEYIWIGENVLMI